MSATLPRLIAALQREGLFLSSDAPPDVTGISADSRSVVPGNWYVAVRGSQADGHRFAASAVERGASAIVVEERLPLAVPQVLVRDGRLAALALAKEWFGNPAAQLTLIGVTGTNGKTTTTALVRHLFNADGTAGSIGTLGAFDGESTTDPSTVFGFLSLGDNGIIDFNLTAATSTASLFLYIGEVGDNGEVAAGSIIVRDTASVPEPGSMALLGLAAAGFASWKRRRG